MEMVINRYLERGTEIPPRWAVHHIMTQRVLMVPLIFSILISASFSCFLYSVPNFLDINFRIIRVLGSIFKSPAFFDVNFCGTHDL